MLRQDADTVYRTAEGLFKMVDDLDWKPSTGKNWMTTGQLLMHCTSACGANARGFITGDWGMAMESSGGGDAAGEAMLPQAEAMPSVNSVDEALNLLAEDKALAMKLFAETSEDRLANEVSSAPWGGPKRSLYQHCNEMIWHLGQHKGQLFYYLKLQGKDVNTMHLWMAGE
jgi:hypothetical protein